jgi:large subunit ribosomal protein L25
MSETITLEATTRGVVGKAARRLRPMGKLPAVVYGAAKAAETIEIDLHEFEMLLSHDQGLTSKVISLKVDGGSPVNVIVKQVQRDVVRGYVTHVDFWAVNMMQSVTTSVQLHFIGESPGVKAGGVMTHNMNEISVEALPAKLPSFIEADISALEIGDALHVSQLAVPADVTLQASADDIVCSVLAPKAAEVEEVVEVEETAEPEIIGTKPEEGEE